MHPFQKSGFVARISSRITTNPSPTLRAALPTPPRGEALDGHGGRHLSEKPNHLRDRRGSKTPSRPRAPHPREQNTHAGHRCLTRAPRRVGPRACLGTPPAIPRWDCREERLGQGRDTTPRGRKHRSRTTVERAPSLEPTHEESPVRPFTTRGNEPDSTQDPDTAHPPPRSANPARPDEPRPARQGACRQAEAYGRAKPTPLGRVQRRRRRILEGQDEASPASARTEKPHRLERAT
ncbi:hypothetical protein S83_046182 [Arachis hypogaea]